MYTPLYIKTNNNILSSIIKIDELVKFALDNNLKSLTITDSNMYGAYDFYKECTKNKNLYKELKQNTIQWMMKK